jgi:hypothetical protein
MVTCELASDTKECLVSFPLKCFVFSSIGAGFFPFFFLDIAHKIGTGIIFLDAWN